VIDACFIAASYVPPLVRHRLPELHYENRVGNALWCSKLFTLGNVSLRKVLPNTKLRFVSVATVKSSKPEPVGVSFLRHRRRKLCLNHQQMLDTELLRLKMRQGIFLFLFYTLLFTTQIKLRHNKEVVTIRLQHSFSSLLNEYR